ncbi:MAG: hypothetical protein QOF35_873, partial [Actinomycetota bacterium]|nr:hypothetical protein [Actinomycetota bacterium]
MVRGWNSIVADGEGGAFGSLLPP